MLRSAHDTLADALCRLGDSPMADSSRNQSVDVVGGPNVQSERELGRLTRRTPTDWPAVDTRRDKKQRKRGRRGKGLILLVRVTSPPLILGDWGKVLFFFLFNHAIVDFFFCYII